MPGDYETDPSEEAEGGPVKSFLEHLEDFRWILIKSAVALVLAMLVCLFGANYVVAILKWPMSHNPVRAWARVCGIPMPYDLLYPHDTNQVATVILGTNQLGSFEVSSALRKSLDLGTNHNVAIQIEPTMIGTNQVIGWRVAPGPATLPENDSRLNIELVNLSPSGAFFVAFQVAFYGGMILASPLILYFIASFVFPALRLNERKHVFRALFFGGGLFLAGISFCYFILMPVALAAAQLYANWIGFSSFQWRAEDYISFVCKFMLGMGIGFELPVVILTLVKIGVVSYPTLAKARRYMIVINLVLGAVLTTPEPITMIVMFVPLQFLYEVTVWIAWYWDRQDRKREAAANS
jgi:sec-independent protein translocase protein TatC